MQAFAELYIFMAIIAAYFAAVAIVAAPIVWLVTRTNWYDKRFGSGAPVSEYTRRKYSNY